MDKIREAFEDYHGLRDVFEWEEEAQRYIYIGGSIYGLNIQDSINEKFQCFYAGYKSQQAEIERLKEIIKKQEAQCANTTQ